MSLDVVVVICVTVIVIAIIIAIAYTLNSSRYFYDNVGIAREVRRLQEQANGFYRKVCDLENRVDKLEE